MASSIWARRGRSGSAWISRPAASALALALASPAAAAPPPAPAEPAPIIVSAPGGAFDQDDALTVTAADLARGGKPDLAAALTRAAPALSLSDTTTNPYQPDLVYRGFTASSLQGSAQGLAAYIDGARFNLPFGDTVDLSLIPQVALERVTVRDASPVYGLNALGGAVILETRTGRTAPGLALRLSGGDYGRVESSAEAGIRRGPWSAYAAFESDREDGWRRFSPSERYAALADIGLEGARAGAHLKLSYADADLTGNAAAPLALLAADPRAVFTHPDRTRSSLFRASLHPFADLSPRTRLEASLYWLQYRQRALNGDAADIEACEDAPTLVCAEDGPRLTTPSGALIPTPPGVDLFGVGNQSRTRTDGGGALVQLSDRRPLLAGENRLTLGFSYDESATRFAASTSLGALDPADRGVALAGPVIATPEIGIVPVRLRAYNRYTGLFAVDRVELLPGLSAELGLRWNEARIRLRDDLGTALDGDHRFRRLNPGAELDWEATPALSLRAGYSEANRAPTPAELSCADEAAPCSLANFFLGDPPLRQVASRSYELGASGETRAQGVRLAYLLSLYRSTNSDDIQLIASPTRGRGYFRNIGETRRQGVEATLRASHGGLTLSAGYAFTDATFETAFALPSPHNPAADARGTISVRPGDRLPSIPRHRGTLSADWTHGRLSLGGDLQAQSGVRYAGDPSGALGDTGAFALVHLRGSLRVGPATLFADVRNLLDRRYLSYGLLSDAGTVPLPIADRDDPRFGGPGQGRRLRVGVGARF